MPAIWSSSERPISVRMVWVDGIRHAILSKDDPFLKSQGRTRRRPQTTTAVKEKKYPLKYEAYKPAEGCIDGCFVKLRLVVEKSADSEASARSLVRRQSAPIRARIVRNSLDYREDESFESSELQIYESSALSGDVPSERGKEIARKLEEELNRAEPAQLNTLSERVLQWLDLTGKAHDYEREESKPNESEEEKPPAVVARRKQSKEEATCAKIVVPTQYVMLQEASVPAVGRVCEKRLYKTKAAKSREAASPARYRQASLESEKSEERSKSCSRIKEEEFREPEEESQWTPPAKPQLHIFMPSLKATEIQWMSSQESLCGE